MTTATDTGTARLMRPERVAIVGVSPNSIGADALANLERFAFSGPIHLVSRRTPEVSGRRCVASIDDLPTGVDVALLCVPRDAVIDSVDACVRRRVGAATIFASGFAETGEAGRADQHRLARIAQNSGIALRASAILSGSRGSPPADIPALVDVVLRLGAMIETTPALAEIEINPLVVYERGKGAVALDALIAGAAM